MCVSIHPQTRMYSNLPPSATFPATSPATSTPHPPVYFVQGILGLSRLAVSFFFKDELHIEPAEVCVCV